MNNTSARSSRVTTRTSSSGTKPLQSAVKAPSVKKEKSQSTHPVPGTDQKRLGSEKVAIKPFGAALQTNLLRVVALLGVIGITLYVYSIREHVKEFERFGYAGVFLIALMANATVLLPAPGVAIIYAMGAIFNPIGIGLAAGTGGALGELSGYLAGFSGQGIIDHSGIYNRFKSWVDKYGGWAILVLSAVPNPFFDVAGIAAGIAKMPMRTFLIFTWMGQIIKMSSFAFAGYYSLTWLTNFFR